jgi:formylglycine-generating enzyme required for sulfatase activity
MKLKFFLLTMVALFFAQGVKANGLQATNISLQGQNITNQTWQVRFNLTWNNSWRDGINYDAAWIFIKFRVGNGPWTHAVLDTNGYVTGTGTATELRVSPDRRGVMVNRALQGSGTYSATGMELRWNYGMSGVQNNDLPQVRVFAIEMVNIPEGPFAIGDGDGGSESVSALGVADNRYYVVTRELSPPLRADANFNNGNNILRIKGDGGVDNNGDAVIDNANYPVGYNSFFMMKYKITMEQYADFLSTLLPLQAAPRYFTSVGSNRYNIQTSGGLFFTSTPDRACNFLSFEDGLAYADWACLRPFTETEYEKTCRGPIAPVLNEYPWGTTSHYPSYVYSNTNAPQGSDRVLRITGTENGQEFATITAANVYFPERYIDRTSMCNSDTWRNNHIDDNNGNVIIDVSNINNMGPFKVGIFVDSLNPTRESGGLSYYGVVEMATNLADQLYNITSPDGRTFSGNHGDGVLTANGTQNVSVWPTSNSALGIKGWATISNNGQCTANQIQNNMKQYYHVSNRQSMENQTYNSRRNYTGFRCARTQWW